MSERIQRTTSKYGWRPDRPDHRDFMAEFHEPAPEATEPVFSLRKDPANPPIWNQLDIGSCTAHGSGGCYAFAAAKHLNIEPSTPSRLFIYYFTRWLEGDVSQDAGGEIRDALKVLATMGTPPESEWPYIEAKFAKKPTAKDVTDALKHEAIKYSRLASKAPTVNVLKNALATGFPVTGGFTVFESFEEIQSDGQMHMPSSSEQDIGGHCTRWVGWDDTKFGGSFEVANSWDVDWGDEGYFWMPYSYMTSKFCSDFWQIKVAQ